MHYLQSDYEVEATSSIYEKSAPAVAQGLQASPWLASQVTVNGASAAGTKSSVSSRTRHDG